MRLRLGRFEIGRGAAAPLGATVLADGANFALWSEHAERVELCLFDASGEHEVQRLELPGRTGAVWHGFVPGAAAGQLYGYRVHGPHAPEQGHRFNANKLLVDPYARDIVGRVAAADHNFGFDRAHPDADLSFDTRDNARFMPKCRLVAPGRPADVGANPRTPWRDTIVYELHVKGFTKLHPDVPEPLRGTYGAIASDAALAHLKSLGVTAVELLPIAAFNDEPHLTAKGLTNYWGYNPYALMAPDPRYALSDARAELAHMVRRLHDHGFEVILDVVFNHTGEGWHLGPTLSLKGIDNASYYRLQRDNRARYVDDAGCGNTLDMSRPHVRQLMRDALRVWADDYGIDGLRFDLATTIARDAEGTFQPHAPVFAEFAADPVLSRLKLIAEPWDCADGGYRLGQFPRPWAEWNDKARDGFRRFWRGDDGMLGEFARRLSGSAEDFGSHRAPLASLNYVTAHDGMRLRDLVTYAGKRNADNGEDNRDGQSGEACAPYGAEGPSADTEQRGTRLRQMKNLLATLFLAQGVPMLPAGDEIGQSQCGNNNPYCQDNAISWIDWGAVGDEGRELLAFTRAAVDLRRRLPALRRALPMTGHPVRNGALPDVTWLSPDGRAMTAADWELPWGRCLGVLFGQSAAANGSSGNADDAPVLALFNAHDGEVTFTLPEAPTGMRWARQLDTANSEPEGDALSGGRSAQLAARSLVVFVGALARVELPKPEGSDCDRRELAELAELAGIAPAFHGLDGIERVTSTATQRALLAAMGFDVSGPASVRAALAEARNEPWLALLPPVVTTRLPVTSAPDADAAPRHRLSVPLTLDEAQLDEVVGWSLRLEHGALISGEVCRQDLSVVERAEIDGRTRLRTRLHIEMPLEPGYHALSVTLGETTAECAVIAAPAACYQPAWMRRGERVWGVACQLYSLRRAQDGGIGDFSALGELVDVVSQRGAALVGVNPLHALSTVRPDGASPYSPSSRQFLNPLYIDVAAVPEANVDASANVASDDGSSALVDYEAVARAKMARLAELLARFGEQTLDGANATRARAFARFMATGGKALERFAVHQVLEEQLGRRDSPAWDAFTGPASPALAAFVQTHARRVLFHCWLQFEAERQLAAAKGRLQLGLYGDLAVGVDPLGADAWADPVAYVAGARIGSPPDQFAAEGQEWGLLPFDPRQLRRAAYAPFIAMMRAAMRHCGAVRIDHVMWFARVFWVPAGGKPSDGAYVRYPLDDLLAVLALESHRHRCVVVGEDLGTVPHDFRARMHAERILSYKLMRFERHASDLYCRPDTYDPVALATPASHDLPTIAGFWTGRDIDVRRELGLLAPAAVLAEHTARAKERVLLVAALADQELLPANFPAVAELDEARLRALIAAVHAFLARTPAALAMLNLEDLTGSREQVNLPGPLVGYPCWRLRQTATAAEIFAAPWVQRMLDLVAAEREASHGQPPRAAAPDASAQRRDMPDRARVFEDSAV